MFLTTYGGQIMKGDDLLVNGMILFLMVGFILILIAGLIEKILDVKKATKKATIQTYPVSAGNTNKARKVA